jgi:hypothetical protein
MHFDRNQKNIETKKSDCNVLGLNFTLEEIRQVMDLTRKISIIVNTSITKMSIKNT